MCRKLHLTGLLAIGIGLLPCIAGAQEFPNQTIKLVVPYAAGGTIDLVARMLGPKLKTELGQAVIVDNRPGGGTMIGAENVARAEPDGHTIFLGSNAAFTIAPQLSTKPNYDPLTAFTALGTIASFPNLILVKPDSPYRTLSEVVAAAKVTPNKVSYASFGHGSTAQLTGEAIKLASGADITEVPYRSGALSVQAILSGDVTMGFDTAIGSVERVQSNQLRALAVTSGTRIAQLPSVPSIAEAGFPAAEVNAWIAVFAPARTPAPVVEKLTAAFHRVVQDAEVKQRLVEMGVQTGYLDGPATMRMIATEYTRFGKLLVDARIKKD